MSKFKYKNLRIHNIDITWYNSDYYFKYLKSLIKNKENKDINNEIKEYNELIKMIYKVKLERFINHLFKVTKIDKQINKSIYKEKIYDYFMNLFKEDFLKLENPIYIQERKSIIRDILNNLMICYTVSRIT